MFQVALLKTDGGETVFGAGLDNFNWSTYAMWCGVKQLKQHDYTIGQISERHGLNPALERQHSQIALPDLLEQGPSFLSWDELRSGNFERHTGRTSVVRVSRRRAFCAQDFVLPIRIHSDWYSFVSLIEFPLRVQSLVFSVSIDSCGSNWSSSIARCFCQTSNRMRSMRSKTS
jgi:hypothetical protein